MATLVLWNETQGHHIKDKEAYGGQMTFSNIFKFYISRVETLQKNYSDKRTGIF